MHFSLVRALLLFILISTARASAEGPAASSKELKAPSISLFQRAKNVVFTPKKAYLDLEDNQVQSVFNMPGRDWKSCEMDSQCKAVAWPDNESEVTVLSAPTKVKAYDWRTDQYVEQEFVKIRYKYKRTSALDSPERGGLKLQEGEGWIEAAYITDKKRNAFFTEKPKNYNFPVCKDDRVKKNHSDLQDIARSNSSLNEVAAAVKKVTGQCVIDPRQPRGFEAGNIYDNYVMPTILKQKVPKITKEDGTKLTSQDLVDIDSLARSMYGEMAGCFKHGLQYPMAVAKIVQNRSEAKDRYREFIKEPHISSKSPLSKVVTSSSQFNVWMAKHGDRMNPSLKMALCPPSNKESMYWQGRTPPVSEQQIWENAIKIATQVVVQPEAFRRRTHQVNGYFYTSGMGKFYKMKQVFPKIEDRKIEKNACLEIWMEKNRDVASEEKSSRSEKSSRAEKSSRSEKSSRAENKTSKASRGGKAVEPIPPRVKTKK